MEDLYRYVHPVTKKPSPMISKETYDIISSNADVRIILTISGYLLISKTVFSACLSISLSV